MVGRIEMCLRLRSGRQVRAFRMPEVCFGVSAEDFAVVGDEGGDVEQDWL